MNITAPSTLHMLLTLALVLLTGCGKSGLNLGFQSQSMNLESPDNPVEQVIPAWQEAEGPGINPKQVSRGFSGQIYFITRNRGLTSEVSGRIRVYVFDDQGTAEEQSKPFHQFDFEPEAWKAHLTMSKLGPAYAVFIPYTRTGRTTAACALRIRYTPIETGPQGPVEGTPVFSQMVTLDLGGVKKPADYDTVVSPESDAGEARSKSGQGEKFRSSGDLIQQVSANGDLVERRGVQTADFESPAERHRDQGRVRLADFEADTGDETSGTTDTVLGDAKLDFLGNEEDVMEAVPSSQAEPRRLRDPRDTRIEALPEQFDDHQTLQTHTIPIED